MGASGGAAAWIFSSCGGAPDPPQQLLTTPAKTEGRGSAMTKMFNSRNGEDEDSLTGFLSLLFHPTKFKEAAIFGRSEGHDTQAGLFEQADVFQ